MMLNRALHDQAVACVTLTLSTSVTVTMSSVATKLSQYREGQRKIESKDEMGRIQEMTLDKLAKERISFGKAKVGQAFPEVFEDHSWTDWFIRTYEKSPKSQHQMYVQYVLKRLDHEIAQSVTKNQVKNSEKMKECRASASADSDAWDQISELDPVETFFEMPAPAKIQQVEEQMGNLSMENKQLASRITNMEMAMQEVLMHVRQLSVKTEP